jgi:hypothetical protein
MDGTNVVGIIQALVPIVCVVVTAVLAWRMNRRLEVERHAANLISKALEDYAHGVSHWSHLHNTNSEEREAATALTSAKVRLVLFAPGAIVMQLAAFERTSREFVVDPVARAEFVKLCNIAREDGAPRLPKVSDEELALILFGRRD